jgi:BirA family biotin operon repressor/biotin-[acetyl-CoA-carboxylase] ligase
MTSAASLEQWPARLEGVLESRCTMLRKATVLRETDSTQDAARRLHALVGEVIAAWRQTSGRGRLGRGWADTGEDGVAVTMVIQRGVPERLAIASAVGCARAVETALGRPVGIKWPNDVVANGGKIAGVLVEQADERALIGIGINVSQKVWSAELAGRAISLAQLGTDIDRLDVLCALLTSMDAALRASDAELIDQFRARDVLSGTRATFRIGERTIHGRVERIDPMHGLEVRMSDGACEFLPAATTSVIHADSEVVPL